MNFGHYIKLLRTDLNWTQPEAAGKIGIEQSYLSKLETNKSIPSNEIFIKLQEAYQFDVNEMTDVIDSNELMKLIEITSVKQSIQAMERRKVTTTRSWLVAGLLLIILGGSFLGAVMVPEIEENAVLYRSMGVLLPGEDLNTFPKLNRNMQINSKGLLERIDQKDLIVDKMQGLGFIRETDEGRRYYDFVNSQVTKRPMFPRWLIIPAIAFLLGGLACFYIARAWRKKI